MLRYIITGPPGVGKSTIFSETINYLKQQGFVVGGVKTPEVRDSSGQRIGFKMIDLLTGEEAWLARVDCKSSMRVGKYGVLVDEANKLVEKALQRAIEEADVIGIDEVGPMELKLPSFKAMLLKILDLEKPAILVIHYRLNDRDIVKRLVNAKRFEVSVNNREHLKRTIPSMIFNELSKQRKASS